MSEEQDNVNAIKNFSGVVITFVTCYYHGTTVDRHEDFELDEYTLATSFQDPVSTFIPISHQRGNCSLEKFLQSLPERFFAYKTYHVVDGEVEANGEEVFVYSLPFAHSPYTFLGGTLHTASEVIIMFSRKRRTKTTEAILQAAQRYDVFVETRTGRWYPYDKEYQRNMILPSETGNQIK